MHQVCLVFNVSTILGPTIYLDKQQIVMTPDITTLSGN
jgi:hypothetical protein